jgi:hypothetical protein
MPNKTIFEKKANKIYETNKNDWETRYYGKIIAIDIDAGKLIAVADSLLEVDKLIDRLCPEHKVFVRRVGAKPGVARVFRE